MNISKNMRFVIFILILSAVDHCNAQDSTFFLFPKMFNRHRAILLDDYNLEHIKKATIRNPYHFKYQCLYVSIRFREIIKEIRNNAQKVVEITEKKRQQPMNQQLILQLDVDKQTLDLQQSLQIIKSTNHKPKRT